MTTTKTKTINWPGASGKEYKYWIHSMNTSFDSKAGNYIFAKQTSPGKWRPVYIGQTGDLSERFDHHHKMECARRNGATHVHAHTNPNEANRLAEETDLVRKWGPVCND